MKKLFLFIIMSLGMSIYAQNVGIGTGTPDGSAKLEIFSTQRGVLLPRLTTAQRNAITNPGHTLIIFNVDNFCLETYDTLTNQWYAISCPKDCQVPCCIPVIEGPDLICKGDTIGFSVKGCCNASGFTWSASAGWVILNGQGTDSITVAAGAVNGSVSVTPFNSCGVGTESATFNVQTANCWCMALEAGRNEKANDIKYDNGGYVILGTREDLSGSNYLGPTTDIFMAKIDLNANLLWGSIINGGTGQGDQGARLVSTSTGLYCAGRMNEKTFIARINSGIGNMIWIRSINDILGKGRVINSLPNGDLIVGGREDNKGEMARFTSTGTNVWVKDIGDGTGNESFYSVFATSDGNILWVGQTVGFGAGGYDAYIVKTDGSGNIIWTRTVGGTGDDRGFYGGETSDGGYLIIGRTNSYGAGGIDGYILKLDSQGNLIWTRTIGGAGNESIRKFISMGDGTYIAVGYTTSFGVGGQDGYIVKFDESGNILWTRTVGGTGNDILNQMTRATDGTLLAVGRTNSPIGGPSIGDNIYIVKFAPNGSINCSQCITGSGGTIGSGGVTGSGGTISPGKPVITPTATRTTGGTIRISCGP